MSRGTMPPSSRAARFAERLRGSPLGEPRGGRSLTWLAWRAGAVAVALPVAVVLIFMLTAYTCACTPPPPTPDVATPVVGVVVSVDAAGLGDVRGFTLRPTSGPFSFGFVLGALENPTEFPPSHLAEHQATSQPVRVFFRTENGIHTVYRLEDAAPSGS